MLRTISSPPATPGGLMDLSLPLARYRLILRATSPIQFNGYSGSAWRGIFGHALKRAACVTSEKNCKDCLLYRQCVYSYIFETPPPRDTRYMRRYTAAPHPFILSPPLDLRRLGRGETLPLAFTLIGNGNAYLPYVVHAFERAGALGIGPTNGTFEIAGLDQETAPGSEQFDAIMDAGKLAPRPPRTPTTPPLPDIVALQFDSPLRLKYRGQLLTPPRFAFAAIVANLLRRVSMLSYFHNDAALDLDFKALVDRANSIAPTHEDLHWYNWARYSNRQKTRIQMDGLIGSVAFRGADIAPWWPLLWLGQYLHAGKATSMGLGGYRLIAAQPQTSQAPQAA